MDTFWVITPTDLPYLYPTAEPTVRPNLPYSLVQYLHVYTCRVHRVPIQTLVMRDSPPTLPTLPLPLAFLQALPCAEERAVFFRHG